MLQITCVDSHAHTELLLYIFFQYFVDNYLMTVHCILKFTGLLFTVLYFKTTLNHHQKSQYAEFSQSFKA